MLRVRWVSTLVTEGVLGLAALALGREPEWLAGTGELDAPTQRAISAVGDPTGEVWLHVLALAVEAGPDATPRSFLADLRRRSPTELMEHVVGLNVPAWHDRVDPAVLAAAARGDADAALSLLTADGYYGGRAAQALPTLLRAGPEHAQHRLLGAMRAWFDKVVAPAAATIAERQESLTIDIDDDDPLPAVEAVTGIAFEPEDYTDEVVLVPQFAVPRWQVLAQHHGTRIIVFDASAVAPAELDVLAGVFAALGEPSRIQLLRHLAHTPTGVSELARLTGLAKSTVHQHVTVLRDAGLVALAGQAWRYRYEARPDRMLDAAERLHRHLTEDMP